MKELLRVKTILSKKLNVLDKEIKVKQNRVIDIDEMDRGCFKEEKEREIIQSLINDVEQAIKRQKSF